MLIETLKNEFLYDCQIRELSPLTIHNYSKQLSYFVSFLETECNVTELEEDNSENKFRKLEDVSSALSYRSTGTGNKNCVFS